jgi:hypothetical protein
MPMPPAILKAVSGAKSNMGTSSKKTSKDASSKM